jgi:hypothetical protein
MFEEIFILPQRKLETGEDEQELTNEIAVKFWQFHSFKDVLHAMIRI